MFTKSVLTYFFLCFAISWGIFFILYPFGIFSNAKTFGVGAVLFMIGPALAALICARLYEKGRMVLTLGLKPVWNKWMVMAWIIPVILCATSVAISLLGEDVHLISISKGLSASGMLPDSTPPPPYIDIIILVQALSLGAGINAILLISEELGWRGFLWQCWISHGFWKTSFLTGVIWGFWHAPLIYTGHNYPEHPILGIFFMVVFTTLISPLIGYVRMKNGSVWAASLFHGTLNALAGLSILVLAHAQTPLPLMWKGLLGIGGVITLSASCIWLYFSLRFPQKTSP